MKKIILLFLAAITALLIAGCGTPEPGATPSNPVLSGVIAPAAGTETVVSAPLEESVTTGASEEMLPSSEMPAPPVN